jgi:hypothetical protein
VNITVYRGDNANFGLTVCDYTGVPSDITDWTFILSYARQPGGVVLFSAVGTIVDASLGRVSFHLTSAQLSVVGKYFYDVEATTNMGQIQTIDSGEINVIQDITQ